MWHHLFVPLDGSPLAEEALPYAAALARLLDGEVTLARVPELVPMPLISAGIWMPEFVPSTKTTEEARNYLDGVKSHPALTGLKVDTIAPEGPVASALLDALTHSGADVMVLTTHGYSGAVRLVLGSVADKLVRHATTPVLVVRPAEAPVTEVWFRRIGVTLDGSAFAEQALPTAIALARSSGAELHLIRVPTVPAFVTAAPETAGWIPELLAEMGKEAVSYLSQKSAEVAAEGVTAQSHVEMVVAGPAADGICRYADAAALDLIVMTTHGRGGLSRWVLGSVTDQVLRQSHTPIWVIRAQEPEETE